jgi:type II secretory pathway pseudopilin PulG
MELAMRIGNNGLKYNTHSLGFTYIGLMIMIAISGIALAGVGIVWHQDLQREREKELIFIGEEYRNAIGSYYENSPGEIKQFPKSLDDLIADNRFPSIKRHLRKLYEDPVSQGKTWGLEVQQGRIVGIYSLSKQNPIKKTGFQAQYQAFNSVKEYSDWKFIYIPGSLVSSPVISTLETANTGS